MISVFSVPVIHEDERLLAVNKPAGLLVIPGRRNMVRDPQSAIDESLVETLSREAGRKLFVVHRLDRGASGLLLFAKDAATHRGLSLAFERREIHKTYLALARGVVKGDGAVEAPVRQFGSGRMGVDPRGKPSVTRFRVKERLRGATLLEIEPESGRRHQIRVHLYSLGHPLVGDTLYGPPQNPPNAPRLMLHAWRLALPSGTGPAELRADSGPDFEAGMAPFR